LDHTDLVVLRTRPVWSSYSRLAGRMWPATLEGTLVHILHHQIVVTGAFEMMW